MAYGQYLKHREWAPPRARKGCFAPPRITSTVLVTQAVACNQSSRGVLVVLVLT